MRGLIAACALTSAYAATDPKAVGSDLSVQQIVEKHVAARGGLQAWRALGAISITGKVDAGDANAEARAARIGRGEKMRARTATGGNAGGSDIAVKQVQLPFVLDLKRPQKSRLEIEFAGKTAVQVFDGTNGWKLRPFLNRSDVEPFTSEETRAETEHAGSLDDPLVDYAAKGSKVEREAVEAVEGHDAYKLKVTTRTGVVQYVWVDAQSFLDVKVGGAPRRMDGKMREVAVYQRDFRPVQGLMMPFLLETTVDGFRETHRMVVEKIALNPKLDDALFAKPSPGS